MTRHPLDPGAARVVDMIRRANQPGPEAGTPAQARTAFRTSRAALAPQRPDVALVKDMTIDSVAGPITIRIYRGLRTTASEMLPVLLFFHSGGWMSGDLDTHDHPCRAIANVGRIAVIAVDYRLAPENPFPAAIKDAQAAFTYLHRHADELGVDPDRIAVGGDSAGANIAAVLTHLLRNAGGTQPVAQVLLYPATDFAADTTSLREFGGGPTLSKASLDWFAANYLRGGGDPLDWRASPLRALDFGGLPPAFLVTCGHDPLRDEGEAYGQRLAAAGVPVHHRPYPGQIHGFLTMGGVIPQTTILVGEVAAYLDMIFTAMET